MHSSKNRPKNSTKSSGKIVGKQWKNNRYFPKNQQPLPLSLFVQKSIAATAIAISDSGSDSGNQQRYRYFANSVPWYDFCHIKNKKFLSSPIIRMPVLITTFFESNKHGYSPFTKLIPNYLCMFSMKLKGTLNVQFFSYKLHC